MAQLKRVEKYAKKLKKYCSEKNIDGEAVLYVVKDIGAELTSNISEDNVDNICSMLLKADGPIHLFFRKCREVTVGDLKTAVSDMLNILLVFLRKRSRSRALRIYTKDLMAQCQRIATGKGHGTVKVLAIELLTRMVDKRDGFETTDEEAKAIYDKFMEQYTMSSVRPTAKQRIVELLGTIAKNYPQLVDGKEANSKLKRWCFQGLNHESKRHFADAELSLVTGYLTCIDILLYRQEEEEQMGISKEEAFVILQPQSPEVQQLFNHILIIITTSKDTNRYQAVIAALSLFKNHCEMFSKLLMDRYVNLYRELHYWATHYNSTCYKFGLGAFEEFLRQLSVVLFHNIHGDREKAIARDLVAQFGQTLLKADSLDSIYEVSVAIRGVGYFSKVFYALENEPDIKIDMYQWRNNLVRISNWFYSETNKNQKEYIRHLPAFIKAYASFAEVQDNIPVDLMQTLQLMCDIFILSFAEMSGYHRRNGSFYIQQLFSMIFNKNKGVFLQFIDGFFEKALICTCTNIHQPDKEDRPAYTELLYFWKVVLELMTDDTRVIKLEIDTQKEDAEIEADDIFKLYNQRTVITNPNELSRIMYDTFISTTLKLIKSFNLKLKNIALTEADLKMEESEQENIQILSKSLRPINQKDFVLFQNLVDFWCTLLKEIDNTYMIHWVHIISTQLIELSTIHQLVSGFYRILAEVLIICEQQNFFRGCKAYNDALKENVNINIEKGMPAEYSTYIIVQEFLKEVWHRLQQFTDELLASCLRLILAYPVEFFDIEELITPLEKALRLGITYHPLATIAMNSLDKLLDPTFRYEISSKFLSCILPCINEYLLVGVISFENDDSIGSSSNNKKKYKTPTASERRYRSVHLKMTSEQIGVIKRNYSSLPELQRRMMQFLGRLGGKNKQLLITQQEGQEQGQENENDNARILSWDTTKKIKLRIPFRTMKVDIYLDEYLPRICELAESSPDRKIKVAACELLHGLVVYMVGNSAFTPRKSKRSEESDYHKFYSRLFPVMLNLAIDADQVTRDMFRVLNSQVIHWLTNNAHYENPETIVLLHTLLDAACQTDAGLREYSAKCIQEFVEWSIKQTPRTTDSVHNIRSLLKRLYNLMASPNASKRFGAALVFNNMYRFFREEETLVNMYTFEILGQLFLNLKIAEVDHPSIGTREQIIEAINHIKRILRQKIDLFMTDNDRRPFIGSDEVVDLPSLVEWTFKESGSLQRTYAKVCINFFNEFAKLLPGIKETHQWLSNQDEKLIETVFLNKHLDLLSDTAPTVFVRQPDGEKDREKNIKATIDAYSNWIKQMNATVDGFVWLVERKIVSPQQLLIQSLSCSSRLFQVVREFFAKRPDTYLKGILEQSVSEKGTILSIYVYVVVRLIYFFDLIFNHDNECFEYATQHAADVLFHEILMNTVAETLLLPKQISERIQTYQGNAVTQSSTKRIYDIGKKYIITMTNKSCQKFEEYLVIAAANIIKSFNIDLISRTEGTTDRSLLIETVQSVDGIQFLQSIHLLEPVCKKMRSIVKNYPRDVQAYYTKLFEYFLTNCYGSQDPLQIQFMGKLVCICFGNEQFARNHAEALLAFSGPLTHLSDSEKLEMVRKYDDFFVESITRNFNVFSRIFKANITNTIVRDYLTLLFDYLMINRLRIRKSVWQITDYLADDPSLLESMVNAWDVDDKPLDLIVCLKSLFAADPGILSRSKRKPIFQLLWDTFIHCFDKDRPYKIKNNALDILPVFVCIDEESTKKVADVLQQSLIYEFPAKQSVEALKKGTEEYNYFISTLDKLMDTMVTFKSVPLFDILKVTFVQEENHVHKEAIRRNIEQFTKSLGLQSFLDITQFCFDYFKNLYYNLEHRKNLIGMVITFLSSASEKFIMEFFKRNIVYIMKIIQQDLPYNASERITALHQKVGCLQMVKAFYELLPNDATKTGSELDTMWVDSNDNTAQQHKQREIKNTLYTTFTSMREEPLASDLRKEAEDDRKAILCYNQAVLNAFIAFSLRFAVKEALFVKIFGKAGKFSRQYIWNSVVDVTHTICLKLELDQPLVKSRLQDLHAASGKLPSDDERNITYMASIALTGSSLTPSSFAEIVSEENKEDHGSSAELEVTHSADAIDEDTPMEENISENTVEIDEIEIDMLNDNTFMRALTEALQKLHNIITPPENYTGDNMPSWLQSLLNAFNEFSDNENEDNIKYQVYIAKLITNYPFAFEKYAKYWILPLMKFIIKGHMFGSPINYLTQDLCIILIVWGKDTDIPDKHQPSTQQTLYSFFVYLIKNAYHSTPRITRSNIQIIKGIFENWGEICPVPTRVIYEQFHHPEGQEDRNIIGLQLAGILYSNGVNIYNTNDISDTTVIDKFIFYEDMAANLKHKNRKSADTSLNAAELMSWTLKIMRDKKDPDEKEIRKMFERQLEKLFENKNLSRKHCLKCVNRAYLHDVDLGKSVIHKVAYRLNDYTMDEKALLLEYLNVCWTEEYDADMLYKIRQIGLLRLLTGRDEVLQIASLKILNTFFSTIKKADVGKFLKRLVKAFPNHPNMKCRTLYYSFLKKVYESKLDPTIETDVKAQLFRGLIDRAASISQDIFEFVKMQLQIDDNILSTVQKLLSVFFVAETEDIYLLYATRIMLNNMRETADFTEPLFDQPLDKTKRFDSEYKFNTAWYNTSSMVPLFVESQEKSQLSIEDLELQLRQTQSLLEFSTTQGTNQTLISTFNPASQETQPTEDISDDVVMAETSSLPSPKFEKKENPYYNRRFLAESRGVSKRFHADRNEQLEKKMRNLLNSRKEAGEKKVVLTRTYRQGEIPDVQISRRDLLLPLEVIATADYNISRLLYSSLTVGIANEFKQSATDEDYATYKEQLVDSIGKNLVKSCMYFTPTIGSFLRIVFDLDAYIPGKVIKVVSARSQNHHIGIAILEKHIMYSGGDDRPKKKVSQLTPTKEKWIHLSLLYQSIDEPEIFQNIYLNNVVENELARDGIEYEIKGNYADAFNKLATASDTSDPKSVDIVEYNLWQEQMLFCRTQLTEWEKISQDTFQATGGNWKSLWGDLQDPYLEYFVRSFSKFKINRPPYDYREADSPGPTTWLKHQPNPLYKFLDDAYDEDVRREKLLDDFACEWAIMEMYRKNYYRGRFFISKAYDSILSAWNTLHPLAHTSRLTKLSRLQRTVEIDDYLRFHKCLEGGFFDLNEFEKFIGALALRYPDTVSDRMDTWYDILITRLEFFDDFTETLLKMSDSANALIRSAKNESLLAIANAAIIQGNANVFAKIRDMFDARARDKRELTNIQYLQRVNTVTLDIQSKGRYLGLLFSKTAKNKIFETAESNDAYNWKLVQLDSFDIVKQNLVSNPDIFNYFTEDALRKFRSSDNWKQILANAGNLANHLEKAGFETLQTAGELLDAENSQRAEYLWRFGKYCDDALRLANDPSSTIHLTLDSTEYGKLVVKCYFQAMDRDHALATGYFPRLMELIELNPDVGDTFMEQSRQLDASWKFIRWIPQLVSFIATPIATFVFVALERIAHNYPKALYYPMQMSYEFYELRKHHLSEETNTFIEKIMALIRSPILEEFSKELKRLTDPALIFRDFVDFVKSINVTEAPRTFIASKYDEFYQLLLNNYSERLGAVQKKVASKYASSIIRMFGEEGAKIPEFTDRNYRELNTLLKTKIEPLTPTESESRSLKAYSPWLHSFKNIEHDEPLEIPGQYTGLSKPYPETHVRIASIDPQILCMRSLRRPKRITLNGTDEMEYHFLVKGGEDLRLDERIEQLFSVMNDALRKNAFCSNQNVRMTTYKVIPMASNLGIIEWVKYTAPLRSTIQRVDTKSVSEAATAKYRAWIISNKRGASDMRSQYHAAFSQPREKIVQMFENARSRFPRKVLKDYLFHLASSPEAFIFLRKEFAHSLACISIYGYIVGIGDRHLDNFLLDLKSGRLVPIDFGYAFGAATELLAIPELVPFRLTRQLITVLEPLGTSGILENAMANILSAVQNEKELLLNVLSVFVKEPLLEWKRQADRLAKQQRKERVSDDDKHSTSATPSKDNCLEWYPQKKIDIVKRKLDMHNPAGTVIAELQNGHADKPYCKDLTRLAKGIARVNLRADVGDVCDSVNEQVKCLIDLATDPAVLGVAYLGWGSFF